MALACAVVIQPFTAIVWRIEVITPLKWIAAFMLVASGFLENLDCAPGQAAVLDFICGPHHAAKKDGGKEQDDNIIGWILVFASVLVSANRWALMQRIFQHSAPDSAFRQRSKLQLMPILTIGCTATCFVLAGIFEHQAFEEILDGAVLQKIAPAVVIVSFAIMVTALSEILIVSITAATVMTILAVVHNIPIVLAGIFLNHDTVYRNQWIGFAICSAGASLYFYARSLSGNGNVHRESDSVDEEPWHQAAETSMSKMEAASNTILVS
jgi:drug/metabolite transporter (DMT)-like permease